MWRICHRKLTYLPALQNVFPFLCVNYIHIFYIQHTVGSSYISHNYGPACLYLRYSSSPATAIYCHLKLFITVVKYYINRGRI